MPVRETSAHRHERRGPSARSLAWRTLVLFGLVLRAGWVLLSIIAHGRGFSPRSRVRLEGREASFARAYVGVAMRFRGGLIKLGQMASLRVDVMPEAITNELVRLQDRVEPHSFDEIEAQLEEELGSGWSDRFSSFERAPIAAASLGQVHEARARDGQKLAVKVLYPGIERSVAVDLQMARVALWLFNLVVKAELNQIYREIRESIQGEMDYLREGRAAEEIARNLATDAELWSHLRIPAIRWETTTRRVLTMEFIEGVKINDYAALEGVEASVDELVRWVSRAFLHMIFRDGFFHCDPHPGNLLVDSTGRIGIIDFGMNKRISPTVLAAVRENVRATVQRDPDRYADSLIEAGIVRAGDRQPVIELARLSFDSRYYNLNPRELASLDFAQYFREVRDQMRHIGGFQLPDGLVSWSRAFSLLYVLGAELAPGLRPLDVVGPYVLEFILGGQSGSGLTEGAGTV